MEEILLGDSDDEFCHSPSRRKLLKGKRKINKKILEKGNPKVADEIIAEPPSSRKTRSLSKAKLSPAKKDTINEEKVKNILSKVLFKPNSTSAPDLERSSSLKVQGKENTVESHSAPGKPSRSLSEVSTPTDTKRKTKLTENWKKALTPSPTQSPEKKIPGSSVSEVSIPTTTGKKRKLTDHWKKALTSTEHPGKKKPSRSVSEVSTRTDTGKKRKLTDHWKKAQTPTKSPGEKTRKLVALEDTDEDDFVDEKKQREKRAMKTKRSKVNDSFDVEAIFNSDDDTADATDTTIEIDSDFENDLEQINVLQKLFNAEVKPKGSCSEKIKKGRSSEISKSITKKKKKKIQPVVIIPREPLDCFDDLITETTRGFPCTFCSGKQVKLQKRREMIRHLQSEHSERLSEEQKNIELAGLFGCEDCGMIVHSKYLLRTHTKAHAKVKQDKDGCDVYYKFYLEIKQTF